MRATSVIDVALVGVPTTEIRPRSISRSSTAASRWWAAISSTLSRTRPAAELAAPLRITALRLPPVPGPNGADAVSPWMTVTSSTSTPRRSATTWATVVSAAHQRLNLAVDADADDRPLAGHVAHGDARWLDVQPEPDAEQPTLGP